MFSTSSDFRQSLKAADTTTLLATTARLAASLLLHLPCLTQVVTALSPHDEAYTHRGEPYIISPFLSGHFPGLNRRLPVTFVMFLLQTSAASICLRSVRLILKK